MGRKKRVAASADAREIWRERVGGELILDRVSKFAMATELDQ